VSNPPRPPLEVACALIEREDRVLVAQRPHGKSHAGKWEFPGGKIEPGESGPQALQREIREELGIEIEVGAALPRVVHDYGTFTIALVPFVCRAAAGEPHPHEHAAVLWCRPTEIAALDLADADRPVLAHYLARVAPG
jgi:8-oxo-dGTP diphosphatase